MVGWAQHPSHEGPNEKKKSLTLALVYTTDFFLLEGRSFRDQVHENKDKQVGAELCQAHDEIELPKKGWCLNLINNSQSWYSDGWVGGWLAGWLANCDYIAKPQLSWAWQYPSSGRHYLVLLFDRYPEWANIPIPIPGIGIVMII